VIPELFCKRLLGDSQWLKWFPEHGSMSQSGFTWRYHPTETCVSSEAGPDFRLYSWVDHCWCCLCISLLVDNCYLFFRQCLDSLSLYKLYSLWLDGHRGYDSGSTTGKLEKSWFKLSFCHLAVFRSQPSWCKLIFPVPVSLCKLHLKCLALAVPKFSLLMLIWITLQFHNEEENFSDWASTE